MRIVLKKAISTFKIDLDKIFKSRVIDVILYGSVIRGGFNLISSDIDFIVLLEGKLSQKDVTKIEGLHLSYRQSDSLVRLLEGRYAGLQNNRFVNGYYIGTNPKGWKPIDKFGFDNLESAMILDAYESLNHNQTIKSMLHFSWDKIKIEILNQIDGFIKNNLLTENESYKNYALVTASRSLYTFLNRKFISKSNAAKWIADNYFEIDHNNPIFCLSKIKELIFDPALDCDEI